LAQKLKVKDYLMSIGGREIICKRKWKHAITKKKERKKKTVSKYYQFSNITKQ